MSAMGKRSATTMWPEIALHYIGCLCADKDGNGTVDFDEFYTWYSSSSRSMNKAEVKVLAYLQRSNKMANEKQ